MIHVIGDSHSTIFAGQPGFVVHWIGASTAYNLINDHSTTKSKAITLKLINSLGSNEKALLIFGEIDCRVHIYNNYVANKKVKPIADYVNETVTRYGEFLKYLQEKNVDFAVMTIQPAGYEYDLLKRQYLPSSGIHRKINKEFNDQLKFFCKKNHIKFVDIYDKIGQDGLLNANYLSDDHLGYHLNQRVMPFVLQELRKIEMI